MNYGNGFFYLAEIGDFRLAQNGRFRPALTIITDVIIMKVSGLKAAGGIVVYLLTQISLIK